MPKRHASTLMGLLVGLLAAACVTVAPLAGPSGLPSGAPASGDKPLASDPHVTTVPATDGGGTPKPRRTRRPRPTDAPTPAPTASASTTSDATTTPTDAPTDTPTPTAAATLNFSLPAVYGSTALSSGFVPDPFSVAVTAGGPASAGYLGGGCTGFTTIAPSYSVNYTSGSFPLLRMYFIGSADTTMIINTPAGNYVCVDDSFGTLNPTIDFNSPQGGRYDIWVGTFSDGGSVAGTLYATENSGNHP